jgi:hypothetical protein
MIFDGLLAAKADEMNRKADRERSKRGTGAFTEKQLRFGSDDGSGRVTKTRLMVLGQSFLRDSIPEIPIRGLANALLGNSRDEHTAK